MTFIIKDEMDRPVRSQADGVVYTSKSALRRSYLASGNPQGVQYLEVGNDPARLKEKPRPEVDRKAINESIEKGLARIARGERPR